MKPSIKREPSSVSGLPGGAKPRKFPWVEVVLVLAVLGGLQLSQTSKQPPAGEAPQVEQKQPKKPMPRVPTQPINEVDTAQSSDPSISKEDEQIVAEVKVVPVPEAAIPPQDDPPELFDREPVLVLTGIDALRDDAMERSNRMLTRAVEEKAWNAYRQFLEKSIAASLSNLPRGEGLSRFDGVWKEPALAQAVLRHQVLRHFPESAIVARVEDTYSGEMLLWLLEQDRAMEEVLLTLKPEDDPAKVLNFLIDAWPNIPGKMDKYFSLALACAVVFDDEVEIPHPIGGQSGETSLVEPMKRLLWFISKNEKGQLTAPVHHSNARGLVWAVCAPVSDSELEWSLDKMHISRKNWGNAFGMIEYLMERAVKGLNPYEEYSFAEILKEGGICVDQSYFCVNTARAQGIPAMILSGETDLGPHAWVGLKIEPDAWSTEIGRIGGVSKGEAQHPQTGEPITEQEVQSWNDPAHQSAITTVKVARHLWLADLMKSMNDEAGSAEAIRLANRIGPSFTETWAALYEWMEKQTKLEGTPAVPANLEEWKNFAKALRLEFKDNPRMAGLAAKAEMEFIFPYAADGQAEKMLQRERRRIERNSGEQADLIAESLKRQADLIVKRGEPTATKEISSLYDSALRDYGGSITGFKMMAEDYFSFLKSDPVLARKAARDIELAFKRVVETGTKDWFRAQTESSIYKMICGYYRTAGDEDRAIMLEKRYEVLLRRAERSAL